MTASRQRPAPPDGCRICGNRVGNRDHTAREMVFGTREQFIYTECGACGCLQLLDVPDDLARFYPETYYSYEPAPTQPSATRATEAFRRARTTIALRLPAAPIYWLWRRAWLPRYLVELADFGVLGLRLSTRSSVCDVGSGNGRHLVLLRVFGFSKLAGFDPFLDSDRLVAGGIPVRRARIEQIPPGWDVMMFNHSFEHMRDSVATLRGAASLLAPNGAVVLRLPIADSWPWRQYGTDWISLDAPRHLFLHTRRSLQIAAASAGLEVTRTFFDSHPFCIWGSELYRRNVALNEANSPPRSHFSASELARFSRQAAALNRSGEADWAGFVLRPAGAPV